MKITILATVMLMAGYFLILYAGVALIQDKKFWPRFLIKKNASAGRIRLAGALPFWHCCCLPGRLALGAWDGVKNRFGFAGFFARFLTMLYGMELYDILFF